MRIVSSNLTSSAFSNPLNVEDPNGSKSRCNSCQR
jgi:hypothetical protein